MSIVSFHSGDRNVPLADPRLRLLQRRAHAAFQLRRERAARCGVIVFPPRRNVAQESGTEQAVRRLATGTPMVPAQSGRIAGTEQRGALPKKDESELDKIARKIAKCEAALKP